MVPVKSSKTWSRRPYIDSCLNLSTLATSPQRPLQRVPNCQNNLSTTGSFFSDWWKSRKWLSNMIRMARRWSMAAVIVSWLCCYFYCCSEHKLTTILKANVASLARFVTWTWIWFKTLVKFLCTLRLYNYYIWMDYHYKDYLRQVSRGFSWQTGAACVEGRVLFISLDC